MPFIVTTPLPLYAGLSGIEIRITTPGSSTRVNGDVNDPMVDTASDGLFAATIAEDLVGDFTYVIYRSGTAIQTGWMRRAAGLATVILDDPRDFTGQAGGAVGIAEITVTVSDESDDPVRAAAVWIAGSADIKFTNSFGMATLHAAPGSYMINCQSPLGFEDAVAAAVSITTEGPNTVDFVLVKNSVTVLPAPLCNVTLPTTNQYGRAQSGVSVEIKFVKFINDGVPTSVIVNTEPSIKSNTAGLVVTPLLRNARYTATYRIGKERPKEITFDVPDAGSYLVVES